MGRVDDISVDSTAVLAEIVAALEPGDTGAQVLAASIRNPMHVVTRPRSAARWPPCRPRCCGRCSSTRSPTAGIERFTADWQSRPEFADWLHGLVRSGVAAQ